MNEPRAHKLSPCRTVVTSFNPRQTPTSATGSVSGEGTTYFDDGDWVLCVKSSPSNICCALSNGEIQIYDSRRLHVLQSLPQLHGSGMIMDLVGAPPQQHAHHVLVSAGTDGRVCIMDLRQPSQLAASFSMPHSHEEALSVSLGYDGNLAAVGSNKAKIHFYDVRQPATPLGSYVNSHTDEVTRVRFQHSAQYTFSSSSSPASTGLLVTGSEDGLACIFDTTQASEDAALKSVMNAQTSIRQVGFFGPNLEGIYCMTGSETMSLWSWESAQCLADYSDIRGLLAVDYLVDAHWDCSRKELSVVAGCNNGDACLSSLSVANTTNGARPQLTTSHCLTGGHRGVVRDWCPISAGLLVTVGEDARMCEWNMTGRQSQSATKASCQQAPVVRRNSDDASKSAGSSVEWSRRNGRGPVRRQRKQRTSAAPY